MRRNFTDASRGLPLPSDVAQLKSCARGGIIRRKRRSALCWKAFAAKTALLFVARKGSTRASILPLVEGVSGAGKKRLAGDTAREATSDEVKELKAEARQLDAGRGPDRKPIAQKNACGGED